MGAFGHCPKEGEGGAARNVWHKMYFGSISSQKLYKLPDLGREGEGNSGENIFREVVP